MKRLHFAIIAAVSPGLAVADNGVPTATERYLSSSLPLLPFSEQALLQSSISMEGNDAAKLQYRFGGDEKGFSIVTSYSNYLEDLEDSSDTIDNDNGVPDGYFDIGFRSNQAPGLPNLDVHFSLGAYGDYDEEDEAASHHYLSVSTNREIGKFKQGFKYRNVGADYVSVAGQNYVSDSDKDSEMYETWVSRSFKNLDINQYARETTRNIYSDSPLVHDTLIGTGLRYNWPALFNLNTSLSHAQGKLVYEDGIGSDGLTAQYEKLEGSVNVSQSIWNANFLVHRTIFDVDGQRSFSKPDTRMFYIGGSLQPFESLILKPSVRYTEEDYRATTSATRKLATYLGIDYSSRRLPFKIMAHAGYKESMNHAWYLQTNQFYSEAGINWEISDYSSARNMLSLTVGYNRFEDEHVPRSSKDDVYIRFKFRSFSLGGVLAAANDLIRDSFWSPRNW